MKLTKSVVKQFEQDQEAYGTEVALFNILWLKAADDLSAIGVRKLSTVTREGRKKRS